MSENGNIKLDPNVLNQTQDTRVPLSDLYGIPVFSLETEQMAKEAKEEEADTLSQIKKQVFGMSFSKEDQEVKEIREQLFQTQTGLTKETVKDEADINHTYFLVVEIMLLVFMVVLLCYQKHRKRKRREENDTYDYGK